MYMSCIIVGGTYNKFQCSRTGFWDGTSHRSTRVLYTLIGEVSLHRRNTGTLDWAWYTSCSLFCLSSVMVALYGYFPRKLLIFLLTVYIDYCYYNPFLNIIYSNDRVDIQILIIYPIDFYTEKIKLNQYNSSNMLGYIIILPNFISIHYQPEWAIE